MRPVTLQHPCDPVVRTHWNRALDHHQLEAIDAARDFMANRVKHGDIGFSVLAWWSADRDKDHGRLIQSSRQRGSESQAVALMAGDQLRKKLFMDDGFAA